MAIGNYLQQIAARIAERIDPDDLPDGPVDKLMMNYALLALVKGTEVGPSDVHDAWSSWMTEIDPTHDALIPFDDLPADAKSQDLPFVAAIRDVAASIQGDR